MLFTVLQMLLSNKVSMTSENTTVEEYLFIDNKKHSSRSGGSFCPNLLYYILSIII